MAVGNSDGDVAISTTCGPRESFSVGVDVRLASTRPLSYSPQITMAAPDCSAADNAAPWLGTVAIQSSILMRSSPAAAISRYMLLLRRPRMLNSNWPAV